MGIKIQGENLSGKTYGRLLVLYPSGRSQSRLILYMCRCSCGKELIVSSRNLRDGRTNSCGCLKKEMMQLKETHNLQRFPKLL